ncbi:unnamed protein product, partial [Penicillium discolor]
MATMLAVNTSCHRQIETVRIIKVRLPVDPQHSRKITQRSSLLALQASFPSYDSEWEPTLRLGISQKLGPREWGFAGIRGRGAPVVGREAVPDTAHRLDVTRGGGTVAELPTQIGHVRLDRPLVGFTHPIEGVTGGSAQPEREVGLAADPTAGLEERREQVELGG